MVFARTWLFSAAIILLLGPTQGSATDAIQDDAQAVFSHEEPPIIGELSDLLQSSIWLQENTTDSTEAARSVASHCCNVLSSTLPGQVLFPDSAEYQAQQASYYSREQSELSPSCRVLPTSAVDVSAVIALATKYDCAFAVRSGGHAMSRAGSNVDATGFTIDLQKMDQVSVLDEGKIVSFASGCRWDAVYSALRPYNLTTTGARDTGVGVAGFLLGGGISALSMARGFASSSIVNYQVVLADGSIRDVNHATLPDLYWALKYGSTNFAVVTRFEMTTYPLPEIWGGSFVFDVSHGPALLQSLVKFTAKLAEDPAGMHVVALAWEPTQKTYIAFSPNLYLAPVAFAPLYAELQALAPEALMDTTRVTDLASIMDEFHTLAPPAGRIVTFTLTFKSDAALPWDIHRHGVEILEPYLNRTGFSWAAIFQPLSHAGFPASGNSAGISLEDGDLVVFAATALWSDPADDEILKETMHDLRRWAESTARERGLLHPFIYMNYASEQQDVMGGLGTENLREMRRVKATYDPGDRFGMYWRGGFKL